MNTAIIRTEQLSRSFGSVQAVNELSLGGSGGNNIRVPGAQRGWQDDDDPTVAGTSGAESRMGQRTRIRYTHAGQQDPRAHRHLARVLRTLQRMSAEDNLDFYGRIYQMPASERLARIKELLTDLDLWDRRGERVGTWSRGMKQQLAVARALLHHPQLVFLDEPVAGLDPIAASRLNNELASLVKQEGVTVFLNTHNMADAQKLANQVGVIRRGKLLAVGTPDELRLKQGGPHAEIYGHGFTTQMVGALKQQPGVVHAEQSNNHLSIELRDGIDVGPLVHLIVQQGGVVEEVRRGTADLEDVFLALMEEQRA